MEFTVEKKSIFVEFSVRLRVSRGGEELCRRGGRRVCWKAPHIFTRLIYPGTTIFSTCPAFGCGDPFELRIYATRCLHVPFARWYLLHNCMNKSNEIVCYRCVVLKDTHLVAKASSTGSNKDKYVPTNKG